MNLQDEWTYGGDGFPNIDYKTWLEEKLILSRAELERVRAAVKSIPISFTNCKHERASVLIDFEIGCEDCETNFELSDLIDGLRSIYCALQAGAESKE